MGGALFVSEICHTDAFWPTYPRFHCTDSQAVLDIREITSAKKAVLVPLVVCLFASAGYLTNLMCTLPETQCTGLRFKLGFNEDPQTLISAM